MGDWPISYGSKSSGQGITEIYAVAHADANTKGNWIECIASTPYMCEIAVSILSLSGNYAYLVDIGIGPAGSEIVLVANLNKDWPTTVYGAPTSYNIPILLPAGTRIAARCQCLTAGSKQASISIHTIPFGGFGFPYGCQLCTTYGAVTADSGGTSIDPGASAGTYGAWVEFSAATTYRIRALQIGIGNQSNTARTQGFWGLDVGIGSAGNEVAIVSGYQLFCHSSADLVVPNVSPLFPVVVPQNSRLSVRAKSGVTDATDRTFDAILYAYC